MILAQLLNVLRSRDLVDQSFWSYKLLVPAGAGELAPAEYSPDNLAVAVGLVAHESSGAYYEVFLVVQGTRVLWLPECRWDDQVGALPAILDLYGLWVGTPAELSEYLAEVATQ